MTTPVNTVVGGEIFVKVSFDGGVTYAHPALINSTRGIKFTASQNAEEVVDTSNQTAAASTVRTPKANDTSISGAGMLDANAVVAYSQFAANNVAQPCKFIVQFPANSVANAMTITGNYYLSSFDITGDFGKMTTCTLQFDQATTPTISVA